MQILPDCAANGTRDSNVMLQAGPPARHGLEDQVLHHGAALRPQLRDVSAIPKLVLIYPLIRLFGATSYRREEKRFHTITEQNAPLVKAMNSIPLLLGRTIVVKAVKPVARFGQIGSKD